MSCPWRFQSAAGPWLLLATITGRRPLARNNSAKLVATIESSIRLATNLPESRSWVAVNIFAPSRYQSCSPM